MTSTNEPNPMDPGNPLDLRDVAGVSTAELLDGAAAILREVAGNGTQVAASESGGTYPNPTKGMGVPTSQGGSQGVTDLAEARRLIERAHKVVYGIAAGTARWRMHIPADEERDSDLILAVALKAGEDLANEVEQLRRQAALGPVTIPAGVVNAATLAAFPGIPPGMSLGEARRRMEAGLRAAWGTLVGQEAGDVNLGAHRRLPPVAPNGCDACSVEPGERHRYPGCSEASYRSPLDVRRPAESTEV